MNICFIIAAFMLNSAYLFMRDFVLNCTTQGILHRHIIDIWKSSGSIFKGLDFESNRELGQKSQL